MLIGTLISFFTLYVILIAIYIYGWKAAPSFSYKEDTIPNKIVSVVIPARNEANSINKCIDSIRGQEYPKSLLEVIIVNDKSTDATATILDSLNVEYIHVLHLDDSKGKKAALKAGIDKARGEIIITTDADCVMGSKWISAIVQFFNESDLVAVAGPVKYLNANGLFKKFQDMDFMGMQCITAASNYLGISNMSNGANFSFLKTAFYEVGAYSGNDQIASGDDYFLMDKLKKKWPNRVKFLKSKEAIVSTPAAETLRDFIHQRIRWASKSRHNTDWRITLVLLFLLLFHILLILSLPYALLFKSSWITVVSTVFLLKLLVDFIFLFQVSDFFEKRNLLWYFIPAQFIHLGYILAIGIISNFSSYEWKDRKIPI